MRLGIIDLVWRKETPYFEAEYASSPTICMKAAASEILNRAVRYIQQSRHNQTTQTEAGNGSSLPKEGGFGGTSTFSHFLTDQCHEISHGTSSNCILNRNLRRLQSAHAQFLRYLCATLQEIHPISFSSPLLDQINLIQSIVKIVERLFNVRVSHQSDMDSFVHQLGVAMEGLKSNLANSAKTSQQENLNDNSHIWGKILRILISRISRQSRLLAEMYKFSNAGLTQDEKVRRMKFEQSKFSKLCLANLVDEYVLAQKNKKQTCLNCESSIKASQMETHIVLCRAFYTCHEEIEELDAEIQAKMHDLHALSASIRKLKSQKIKELQFNHKSNKGNQNKFNNKFSRSLYDSRNRSEFLVELNKKISEESDEQTLSQSIAQEFSLKELTIQDLSKYLGIVQDIRRIALRVKNHKKQFANLNVYIDIKEFKREIKQNFENLQSRDVSEAINLVTKKLKLIRKLKELETKMAKRTGHKRSPRFQSQYEQLGSLKSESIIMENISQSEAYSDDESVSASVGLGNNDVSFKDFKIIKLLAQGKYGEVYLVKKIKTGMKYAMKKIKLKYIDCHNEIQKLRNENNTFSIVNNDFLIKAVFSFTEGKHHYFIMEYAPNGDFADKLMEEQRLFEYQAKPLLAEIAVAINSLHEVGIIHRDIKPQNIVIDSEGHLKLTDYGLSETDQLKKKRYEAKTKTYSKFIYEEVIKREINKPQQLRRDKIVGSPYYMAPEVLSFEPITKMSDWWSFGILVYQTLVGQPPFLGKNLEEISSKILEGNIWWTNEIMFGDSENMISYEAKDFIQQLLTASPEKRLGQTFEEIKSHKFFTGINWQNLRQTPSPIQVPYQSELSEPQDEESDESFSFCGSTSSDLKLIRRDILSKETKVNYYKHLGFVSHLRHIAQSLRNWAGS